MKRPGSEDPAAHKKLRTEYEEASVLLSLIPELLVLIFKKLPKLDLCMLRLSCRRFWNIIDKHVIFLYVQAHNQTELLNLIQEFPRVEGLRIDDCKFNVASLPAKLHTLLMFESCYPYISPKFNKLTNLTALVINIDSHLLLENFSSVAANLRVLKLWSDPKDTPFPAKRSYEQVKIFAPNLCNLKSLAWDYVSPEELMTVVQYASGLEELTLDGYQITPQSLSMLPTGLIKLALWNSVQDISLQIDDFNRLTQLTKLDYVDLDDFLPAVHVLPRLSTSVRRMKISSCKCINADLKKLPTSVTSLTLFSCELVTEIPRHIKELYTARSGIPIIGHNLPDLQTLKWSGRHDYVSIAQLPTTINKLSLICTFPIPLHLEQCRFPPGLTSLSLSNFSMTDADMRNLPSSLRSLEITKSPDLTDACIRFFMPSFLPFLRQLAIAPGNEITAEALNKLPPHVVIYRHAHNNMWNSKLHSHLPSLYFF